MLGSSAPWLGASAWPGLHTRPHCRREKCFQTPYNHVAGTKSSSGSELSSVFAGGLRERAESMFRQTWQLKNILVRDNYTVDWKFSPLGRIFFFYIQFAFLLLQKMTKTWKSRRWCGLVRISIIWVQRIQADKTSFIEGGQKRRCWWKTAQCFRGAASFLISIGPTSCPPLPLRNPPKSKLHLQKCTGLWYLLRFVRHVGC